MPHQHLTNVSSWREFLGGLCQAEREAMSATPGGEASAEAELFVPTETPAAGALATTSSAVAASALSHASGSGDAGPI